MRGDGGKGGGEERDGGGLQTDASHVVISLHNVVSADVSAAHVVDAETALVLNDGQYVAREENEDA